MCIRDRVISVLSAVLSSHAYVRSTSSRAYVYMHCLAWRFAPQSARGRSYLAWDPLCSVKVAVLSTKCTQQIALSRIHLLLTESFDALSLELERHITKPERRTTTAIMIKTVVKEEL